MQDIPKAFSGNQKGVDFLFVGFCWLVFVGLRTNVLDVERCVGFIDGTPGFEIRCSRITVFQIVESVFVFVEKIGTQTPLLVLERGRQVEATLEFQGVTCIILHFNDEVQDVLASGVQAEKIRGGFVEEVVPFEGIVGFQEREGIVVGVDSIRCVDLCPSLVVGIIDGLNFGANTFDLFSESTDFVGIFGCFTRLE